MKSLIKVEVVTVSKTEGPHGQTFLCPLGFQEAASLTSLSPAGSLLPEQTGCWGGGVLGAEPQGWAPGRWAAPRTSSRQARL